MIPYPIDKEMDKYPWAQVAHIDMQSSGMTFGGDALIVRCITKKTIPSQYENLISAEIPEKQFATLVATWKDQVRHSSSIHTILLNPSYQKIIGMGHIAIPLIFQEMKKAPGFWFDALKALTQVDPITPDQYGDIKGMTQTWLEWGKKNGYVS